jgi:hypothetical protein
MVRLTLIFTEPNQPKVEHHFFVLQLTLPKPKQLIKFTEPFMNPI